MAEKERCDDRNSQSPELKRQKMAFHRSPSELFSHLFLPLSLDFEKIQSILSDPTLLAIHTKRGLICLIVLEGDSFSAWWKLRINMRWKQTQHF